MMLRNIAHKARYATASGLLLFALAALAACSDEVSPGSPPSRTPEPSATTETERTPDPGETSESMPTESPADTPAPTPTATPVPSLEELQGDIVALFSEPATLDLLGIQSVSDARFSGGVFQLEYRAVSAERDSQPDISFAVARTVGTMAVNWSEWLAGEFESNGFHLALTIVSSDGEHRYHSESSLELLHQLGSGSLTFDEWTDEAGGAFQ